MNEIALRKQQLLTEGFAYRLKVGAASHRVREALHPEALSHGVVGMIAKTAFGLMGGSSGGGGGLGSLGGIGLQTILPLLMSGGSMLFRRSAGKPLFRKVLLAAVAGAVAFFVIKKRREAEQD